MSGRRVQRDGNVAALAGSRERAVQWVCPRQNGQTIGPITLPTNGQIESLCAGRGGVAAQVPLTDGWKVGFGQG